MRLSHRLNIISKGLAVYAATSLGLISANASTLVPSFDGPSKAITKTTPNHAVFLKCKVDGNWEYQSKGVILNYRLNSKNWKQILRWLRPMA